MYGAASVSALLRGDSLNAVLLGGAVYAESDYANNNSIYGGDERSSDTDSNCTIVAGERYGISRACCCINC